MVRFRGIRLGLVGVGLGLGLGAGPFEAVRLGLKVQAQDAQSGNLAPGEGLPLDGEITEGTGRPADARSNRGRLVPPLPPLPPQLDPIKAKGAGQYVLEFNRSPLVGSRLQLRGIYDEARLRFTRPRNWTTQDARVLLRFRHSPALYATRSNLTVLVNGTSVGSVPLNFREGEIGDAIYPIPLHLLQDYNEVVVAALQNNSPTCTQDPFDPSLWTEVMPDSKLVFQFKPEPLPLDFKQYPYPFFDELSLEPNRVAYLLPQTIDETWLTAIARFQTSLGRLAQYRPLETRLVRSPQDVRANERLVVIGTPEQYPSLRGLAQEPLGKAEVAVTSGERGGAGAVGAGDGEQNVLDGNGTAGDLETVNTQAELSGSDGLGENGVSESDLPLEPGADPGLVAATLAGAGLGPETPGQGIASPGDPNPGLKLPLNWQSPLRDERANPLAQETGLLMMGRIVQPFTGPGSRAIPVLMMTGNTEAAVTKAVQFLIQGRDRELGIGQTIMVNQVQPLESPDPRQWPRYLPVANQFQLGDLSNYDGQAYGDVTVRGAQAPPVEFDFRALPDDQFLPGNVLRLDYSYGPQINPLTSLMEVRLDGLALKGQRLDDAAGRSRQSLTVPLPETKIRPNSKIQVLFQLDPRERRSCNRATDQQLWGTVHATSQVELKRQNRATLPNLELLQSGYPFAAPQDLSRTTVVLPDTPSPEDLALMLTTVERLGRISRSEGIQLSAYRAKHLPAAVRRQNHLIGIGTQASFPLPEALSTQDGFRLLPGFQRQLGASDIRAFPDVDGMLRTVLSPWNRDRVVLALTAQYPQGLDRLRDVLSRDGLFFQLKQDTVLVSLKPGKPASSYDPQDYLLEFLARAPEYRQVSATPWLEELKRTLLGNWLVLVPGVLLVALVGYGVATTYLKRYGGQHDDRAGDAAGASTSNVASTSEAPSEQALERPSLGYTVVHAQGSEPQLHGTGPSGGPQP